MEKIIEFLLKKQVIGTVIVIILAYLFMHIVCALVEKMTRKSKTEYERKRRHTVVELIKNIVKFISVALAVIIILDLYGVNVSSLIASLGIASAVGALALQDTLKDIISGAAIIMDNYYVVGDYVTYNDFTGKVIEFGLKSTKIMGWDGDVLIVANRNINEIINLSQKTASSLIIAPTAYEEKIDKVEKILNEIVEEICTWPTVDKQQTKYIGITELKDSCVDYGIRLYCSPGKVWEYKRAALRLVKQKYDEKHIKIPYNQVEVHNAK